jgi:MFS family permease
MAFFVMSFVQNFYLHLLMYALVGISLNISNISLMALFQKIVPNEVRGKVFGLLTSASVSSQPISYGIMGLITDVATPSAILLFCAFALTLTSLYFLIIKELKLV